MKDHIMVNRTNSVDISKYIIVTGKGEFPPDHPHFDNNNEDWYYDNDLYDLAVVAPKEASFIK